MLWFLRFMDPLKKMLNIRTRGANGPDFWRPGPARTGRAEARGPGRADFFTGRAGPARGPLMSKKKVCKT